MEIDMSNKIVSKFLKSFLKKVLAIITVAILNEISIPTLG